MDGGDRPMRRGTLSRSLIVKTALDLIDTHGMEALSMRRLASAVGCEAMSLYKHVPDKQALLESVVEHVLAGFRPPDPTSGWEGRLIHVADELRRMALAHPHVFPLIATRFPTTTDALAPVEATLAALCDAGLSDEAVVRQFWVLVAFVTGALIAECAATTGVEQAFPTRLPPPDAGRTPHVARLAGRLGSCGFAEEYGSGLRTLLSSVASIATSR